MSVWTIGAQEQTEESGRGSLQILLVNVHSARNLGDAGIMQATLTKLGQRYPTAQITVAANDPASWAGWPVAAVVGSPATWLGDPLQGRWRAILWRGPLWVTWLAAAALLYRLGGLRWTVGRPEQRATQRAYYAADVVVSCGGGNFYAARPASPALWAALIALAWASFLGKPVVMLPQSLGPIVGRVQRWVTRQLLRPVAQIWVREPRALATAQTQLGLTRRVDLLPDLALGLPPVAARPLPGGLKLGLCAMDRGAQHVGFADQAVYERALVEFGAGMHRSHGVQIYLVAQVFGPSPDQDDRTIAARLQAQFAARGIDATRIDDCTTPAEIQAVYAALDLVVATRMHAAIFALTCGTPVIVLGYQPKSCGMMEMIGLGNYCWGMEDVSASELAARARAMLDQPAPVRAQIAAALREVRATLDEASLLPPSIFPTSNLPTSALPGATP
jgi:colanic acid/amylovoran biosynthesis protein